MPVDFHHVIKAVPHAHATCGGQPANSYATIREHDSLELRGIRRVTLVLIVRGRWDVGSIAGECFHRNHAIMRCQTEGSRKSGQ